VFVPRVRSQCELSILGRISLMLNECFVYLCVCVSACTHVSMCGCVPVGAGVLGDQQEHIPNKGDPYL